MEFHGRAHVIAIGPLQVPWKSTKLHGFDRVLKWLCSHNYQRDILVFPGQCLCVTLVTSWDATLFTPVYLNFKQEIILTLNVPGDCGSSRPTRVEPRLHCVSIEWQVRGRCVGSAAHSPLHAIEPRPTHFARVRALGVPRTHNAAHALCVGPRTLRGSAHFAWARAFYVGSRTLQPARLVAHTLISFCMQFSTHSICYPCKSRPMVYW